MDDEDTGLDDFCRREYPRLVGALTLVCGDRDLALDLAQETLVRVCQHWTRVARMDAPGAWAHRTALNLARSGFRRRRIERRAASLGWHPAQPEDAAAETAESLDLRSAVARLPPRQRTALVLRYYLDHDVAATAVLMGCRPGTVRALTSQAVATLRTSVPSAGAWSER